MFKSAPFLADITHKEASESFSSRWRVVEIRRNLGMKISERRKEPRYLCFGQVKLNRLSGAILSGRIIDLSLGGCLIATHRPAPLSQGSVVELTIQTRGTALRMKGVVSFLGRQAPRWMGISFKTLSQRGQSQLTELIAELEAIPAPDRNLCFP